MYCTCTCTCTCTCNFIGRGIRNTNSANTASCDAYTYVHVHVHVQLEYYELMACPGIHVPVIGKRRTINPYSMDTCMYLYILQTKTSVNSCRVYRLPLCLVCVYNYRHWRTERCCMSMAGQQLEHDWEWQRLSQHIHREFPISGRIANLSTAAFAWCF